MAMLRLSVRDEEFLMIGDDVKIVFLGSSGGQTRIMIDAPKDVNIVRSKAIENGSRIRSFWRRSRSITRIRKAPPRRKNPTS